MISRKCTCILKVAVKVRISPLSSIVSTGPLGVPSHYIYDITGLPDAPFLLVTRSIVVLLYPHLLKRRRVRDTYCRRLFFSTTVFLLLMGLSLYFWVQGGAGAFGWHVLIIPFLLAAAVAASAWSQWCVWDQPLLHVNALSLAVWAYLGPRRHPI